MLVCAVVSAIGAITAVTTQSRPHVVLLDLKWQSENRDALHLISTLKEISPQPRIIAVSADDRLLRAAKDSGADMLLGKDFSKQQLLDAIRGPDSATVVPLCAKTETPAMESGSEFRDRLRALQPGYTDARAYETLMAEIIPFVFGAHLQDFQTQVRHGHGGEVWDLAGFNKSSYAIWETFRVVHKSSQVIFEFKNVDSVSPRHVLQLADYVSGSFLNVGLLVSRSKPKTAVLRKLSETRTKLGCVLLWLSDCDIEAMLDVRANSGEPSDILASRYSEMMRC